VWFGERGDHGKPRVKEPAKGRIVDQVWERDLGEMEKLRNGWRSENPRTLVLECRSQDS